MKRWNYKTSVVPLGLKSGPAVPEKPGENHPVSENNQLWADRRWSGLTDISVLTG